MTKWAHAPFFTLKPSHLVLVTVIFLVAVMAGLQINSHYAYQFMIAGVSMDGHDEYACHADCARSFEAHNPFKCAEVEPWEFACREGREAVRLLKGSQVGLMSTYPLHYGEILALSEGRYDRAVFDIAGVEILDAESGATKITFAPYHDSANIAYVATVLPGNMFLASCSDDKEPVHLFRHSGTFEHDGVLYVELWAAHPIPPPGLVPCDLSEAIETSLQVDYSIVLPDYQDFGFGQ